MSMFTLGETAEWTAAGPERPRSSATRGADGRRTSSPGVTSLAIFCAYAAGLAVWTIAAGRPASGRLGDLARLPVFAVPGLTALADARLRSGRDRRGWSLVGAAWLLSAAACLAWIGGAVRGGEGLLDRLADDVLYNAYYPLMIAGLLTLTRLPRGPGARLRMALDALIVVAATQALAWYCMLRYLAAGEVLSHWSSIATNQIGETLVLFCGVLVVHRPSGDGEGSGLRMLALGALAATVADLAAVAGDFAPSVWGAVTGEVAMLLASALIAAAALLRPGLGDRRGFSSELAVRVIGHLPHAAVFVVAVLLVGELPGARLPGSPVPVLAAALAVLTGLAIVRLAVAQRDAEAEAAARAAQEERVRQGRKLEALGLLAGTISHDFANLLTALTGCVLELREREPVAREAAEIQKIVERGKELCRGLLTFARRTPAPCVADLRVVVDGAAPLLRRILPSGITLLVVQSPDPVRADVEPGQIEVALMNLVVNARDAMPHGGTIQVVTDSPELPERDGPQPAARSRRWARLAVRDGGCGMDEATIRRCSEPFFTTKPAGRGTGLGLASVNDIVRASGGRLDIESAPGRGTCVTLLIPLTEESSVERGAAPTPIPLHRPAPRVPRASHEDGTADLAIRRAGPDVP